MFDSSSPVATGTFLYFLTAFLVIIWAWAFSRSGYISKDSFQIISVITCCAIVATWLLWLCCWMHQWHPLIFPEWNAAE